jgi:hypothetical protein
LTFVSLVVQACAVTVAAVPLLLDVLAAVEESVAAAAVAGKALVVTVVCLVVGKGRGWKLYVAPLHIAAELAEGAGAVAGAAVVVRSWDIEAVAEECHGEVPA